MKFKDLLEIDTLIASFLNKTLAKEKWTHEAHLTAGLWFLKKYSKNDAICRLKSAIILYNHAVGGENTGDSGYHETLTIFWMNILADFMAENERGNLVDLCNLFFESKLCARDLPFKYYDKETLMSTLYRAQYFEPNLKTNEA